MVDGLFLNTIYRRAVTLADRTEQRDNLTEILNGVSEKVSSSGARSLWEKMRNEMQSGGTDAAVRYLGAELDRCKQDFDRELSSLREMRTRRQGHE